jgi:hypothetical protein
MKAIEFQVPACESQNAVKLSHLILADEKMDHIDVLKACVLAAGELLGAITDTERRTSLLGAMMDEIESDAEMLAGCRDRADIAPIETGVPA